MIIVFLTLTLSPNACVITNIYYPKGIDTMQKCSVQATYQLTQNKEKNNGTKVDINSITIVAH